MCAISKASTLYTQEKAGWNFQKNTTSNLPRSYKNHISFKEMSTFSSDDSKNFEDGTCRTLKHTSELLNEIPQFPKQEEPDISPSAGSNYRAKPLLAVKTKKESKDEFEFNGICLEQEVQCGSRAIWVARFSSDGSYLATSGEDGIVRIWEVGRFNSKCN